MKPDETWVSNFRLVRTHSGKIHHNTIYHIVTSKYGVVFGVIVEVEVGGGFQATPTSLFLEELSSLSFKKVFRLSED